MLAYIPRTALAEETPCQANEVLVDITIAHQPLASLEFLDISITGPQFRQAGSNITSSNDEVFRFYQRLLESESKDVPGAVSVCVPGDQCLVLMVQVNAVPPTTDGSTQRYELSVDDISVVYNGQVVSNLQGRLPYWENGVMIAGEIGDCEIVCDSGETLLKIDAAPGSIDDYDWQVFDDITGQMIAHCPASFGASETDTSCYWRRDQFYSDRLCLANDGCYTLVIGQMYLENIVPDANVMNVAFDGNPIGSFENMRYVSLKLNEEGSTACEASGCDSDSRPLEIFIFRNYLQMLYRNLTWSVSSVEDEEELTDGLFVTSTVSLDDRAFYYHQACIPNVASCIEFKLSMPPENNMEDSIVTEGDSTWNVTYRLVLDGITYGDNDYETTLEPVLFAGNCSGPQICPVDFMPVQVDLTTGPTWTLGEFPFQINYHSTNGMNGLSQNYKSIHPGESYRFFPCVQATLLLQDEAGPCTAFYVDAEQFVDGDAEYIVSVNGVVYSERYMPEQSPYFGDMIATPLAGSCEMLSSTKGSHAGIMWMMASLLLLVRLA